MTFFQGKIKNARSDHRIAAYLFGYFISQEIHRSGAEAKLCITIYSYLVSVLFIENNSNYGTIFLNGY